jgi:hypothetical protein
MSIRRPRATPRPGGRRGAVPLRGASVRARLREWLADRTVRRRWRRLSVSEWLVVVGAVVVAGAFLLLLGRQALWLAVLIGLALALYLYRELGD